MNASLLTFSDNFMEAFLQASKPLNAKIRNAMNKEEQQKTVDVLLLQVAAYRTSTSLPKEQGGLRLAFSEMVSRLAHVVQQEGEVAALVNVAQTTEKTAVQLEEAGAPHLARLVRKARAAATT